MIHSVASGLLCGCIPCHICLVVSNMGVAKNLPHVTLYLIVLLLQVEGPENEFIDEINATEEWSSLPFWSNY